MMQRAKVFSKNLTTEESTHIRHNLNYPLHFDVLKLNMLRLKIVASKENETIQ